MIWWVTGYIVIAVYVFFVVVETDVPKNHRVNEYIASVIVGMMWPVILVAVFWGFIGLGSDKAKTTRP